MTVIAWDGKTLAADKRFSLGNAVFITSKIYKIVNSQVFLCGFSHDASSGEAMLDWFAKGCDIEQFPLSQRDKETWSPFLAISQDGSILRYERTPYPIKLLPQKIAIGSGGDFAMAAMHCGKTAQEAVEIACLYDATCGDGVDYLTHD